MALGNLPTFGAGLLVGESVAFSTLHVRAERIENDN